MSSLIISKKVEKAYYSRRMTEGENILNQLQYSICACWIKVVNYNQQREFLIEPDWLSTRQQRVDFPLETRFVNFRAKLNSSEF